MEILRDTEEQKKLSTSTEVKGETAKDKIIRHTQGKPTRQPTDNNNNNYKEFILAKNTCWVCFNELNDLLA